MAYARFLASCIAAAGLAGCMPDASAPTDGGAGSDAAKTVTYTKDVQPIFMAKCAPCHTGQDMGMHNIGTTYADALKPIESFDSSGCWNDVEMTMPKKVGECALILITSGQMPFSAGCGGSMPLDPSACLSADQKATIAAWVQAGMPQ